MPLCPHCRQEFDASEAKAFRCPKCGNSLDKQMADPRATVAVDGPSSGPRPRADQHSEGSIDLDLIGGGEPIPAPGAATVEFSGRKTKPVIPPSPGATDKETADEIKASPEDSAPPAKRSTVADQANETVEFGPGPMIPGGSSAEPDEPPGSKAAQDADDRETIDNISLSDIDLTEQDDPPQKDEAPHRQTAGEPKRATHRIKHDLTVDTDATGAVDADLAKRMTGEWGDAAAGCHNDRQTLRTDDAQDSASGSIKDTFADIRSTLPIRSRSLRERPSDSPSNQLSPSEAVDYELLKQIGEGGMGVVYAAHQSSIARTVAIKMLKPGVKVTADQRDKFLSEAVVTGDLDHPNIVPIYDLGANSKGALFYAMKRVKGTPWDEVFKEKSIDENLGILLRVGDAVAFAHASGVVHRDLKPENVMLGDFGEVLVMDWGLARVTPKFRNAGAVYQSHSLGGTPAYMAPEMARGPIDIIDARSDVYLLGAILYEIIAGDPPHSGDDVMKCLMAAAQNKIDPIDPELIKGRSELVTIALKAMQTNPKDRYPAVKEFQAAVRAYQSHSESLVLSNLAEKRLAEAQEKNDYGLFSSALFGFQESLTLWPENEQASRLLQTAQTSYARAAHAKEDYDLAASLLDSDDPEHHQLLAEVDSARGERDARRQRLRRAKRLAMALAAVVIGVTTFSYFAVREQRNRAVTAREQAVEARDVAEAERQRAEREQARAEASELVAIEEREVAILARRKEEQARMVAVAAREEEAKAKEEEARQRAIAEKAKEGEEYESYVAQIGLAAENIEENAFDAARRLLAQCQPAELRHWEWGRLAHLCQLSPLVFENAGPVDVVTYSPRGVRLLSGDWKGELTLRDAATGEKLFSLTHGERIYAAAFSPDGQSIATGSSDGAVRIVDATTGKLIQTLPGHDGGVLSVAFSPDGRLLLTGGYDNAVRLWDTDTGKQLSQGLNHTWWVWSAQFSPDGSQALSAGQDGRVIVWQISPETQQLSAPREFSEHQGPVYDAVFSIDGSQVASAGYDGVVRLWSPEVAGNGGLADRIGEASSGASRKQAPHRQLKGHGKPIYALAFSSNGQWLLSGGADNTLQLWNTTSSKAIKSLRGHGGRVMACTFSPDGQWAASGSFDRTIRQWDVRDYAEQRALQTQVLDGHRDGLLSAQFSQDGAKVITASRDRTASVWSAATGERLESFGEGHEFLASTAEFFDDGRRLATGAGDHTVRLWDVATGGQYATLRPTGRTGALAIAPTGQWLVTGGRGAMATVWNAETGAQLAELTGHQTEVTAVAISSAPDGRGALIATGDDFGQIRLWRVGDDVDWNSAPPLESEELQGHSRSITGLTFANGGALLVSSSGDNTCGQWDTATGREIRNLVLKHKDWVGSLAVSADGRFALTSCDDGFARLWRLADATVIGETAADKNSGTPVANGAEPKRATFTSVDLTATADRALLTSGGDRSVLLWNLEPAVSGAGAPAEPRTLLSQETLQGNVWASRFADSGEVLTIGGADATLWDTERMKRAMDFSPHGAVASAAMSASGALVATGSWDHSVKLWDVATGQAAKKLLDAHSGPVNSVAFAPGSDTELLTASDDQSAAIWNLDSPTKPVLVLRGHAGRVEAAAYSADGARVLTVSSDETARVWDRETGQLQLTLGGHEWGLLCGEFSPDGARIVTGAADNNAIVWDAHTGTALKTLAGHSAPVTSVAFSPDGARILTGSQDGAAKLWDSEQGKEILTLEAHQDAVTGVDFSPDGLVALTAGHDGVAILWLASPWEEEPDERGLAR